MRSTGAVPAPSRVSVTRLGRTAACLALAVGVAACSGGADEVDQVAVDTAVDRALASQAAPAQPETGSPPETAAAAVQAQPEPSPAVAQVDFVMPSFQGKNLQVAQDEVQVLGIFFSVSHDLLGARSQLIDSNWKVCTQTPAPGTSIKGSAAEFEGAFDFGAVKLTEACP